MTNLQRIQEAQDVKLYKALIRILGEYSSAVPATGVDGLFDAAVKRGSKILPKDKTAVAILKYVLEGDSAARVVHKLLNMRFSNLPANLRPLAKEGRKHLVAHWSRKNVLISDRVKDLIAWDGSGAGHWSDLEGGKVELIDMMEEV